MAILKTQSSPQSDQILMKFWKQMQFVAQCLCESVFLCSPQKWLRVYQIWTTLNFLKYWLPEWSWLCQICTRLGVQIPQNLFFLETHIIKLFETFYLQWYNICKYQMGNNMILPLHDASEPHGWGGSGCFSFARCQGSNPTWLFTCGGRGQSQKQSPWAGGNTSDSLLEGWELVG